MSKQRKLRSKLSFDADESEAADAPPPPPAPTGTKKDGSFKPKKSAMLSFGDEEEPLTSSSSGKAKKKDKGSAKPSKFNRGAAAAPVALSTAADAAAYRPTAGEYTAERLAALQASTAQLPSKYKPAQPAATATAARPGDGSFKLSGSFKALKKPNDDRFSYGYSIHGTVANTPAGAGVNGAAAGGAGLLQQLEQEHQQPEQMPLPPPPKRPGGGGTAAAAAGSGSGSDRDDEGFALPDEETIRRAKAKRERLRQAHLAPDYLPLGGASKLLGETTAAAGDAAAAAGRAYAGSDSDGEQDGVEGEGLGPPARPHHQGLGGSDSETELEERMRLTFVGQRQQQQQQQSRGRAGGSSKAPGSSASRAAAAAALASGMYTSTVQDREELQDEDMADQLGSGPDGALDQQQQRLQAAIKRNAAGGGGRLAGAAAAGAAGRGEVAIAAAAAGVLEALQEAAGRATARHKQLAANLKRTSDNLVSALEEAERIRADITSSGAKYASVQATKAYLADLADCLAAKGPLVEELCDTLQQLRVEAAEALRQQQQDDESILTAQADAAVAAALSVLGNGGAPPAAAAAAESAAADAEAAAVAAAAAAGGGAGVDEFGRDLGLQRRQELQRGAGRRAGLVAGLMQQLAALQQGGALDLEAAPTAAAAAAGEADAVQHYKRRRLEVLDLAPTVFADTDEQYASLTAVKDRLEGFKGQYPREYSQAYIGESAAALFAPYVRLELLQWEPLPIGSSSGSSSSGGGQQQKQQQAVVPFDTQAWYQQLFEFGLGVGDAAAGGGGEDADANLVPQLVESLVLPMALTLVAKCWEPTDLAQSRAVVALVSDLFVYVPADKEDMAQLLALTTGSLEAAAAATTVPPWPSAAAAASPIAQALLQLRFRRAAALLRGLVGFKELLNQGLMFKLALQGLVGQQLVPCLRSSLSDVPLAVARAEAMVLSLPGAWFQQGGAPPPREAQSLLEVVSSLGRSVEQQLQRQQQGGGVMVGYARRVAALLTHLGLKEQAQQLQLAAG